MNIMGAPKSRTIIPMVETLTTVLSSESGSTSWDGSSARGDEEEINITLQCHSDREHIGDDGDCGMRLDWKRVSYAT